MFLEISQNSQEHTCARVSILIKYKPESCNFIKIETLALVPVNLVKFLRTPFLTEHLRWLLLNIKLRVHFGSTGNNSNEPRFKTNSNLLPDKLPSCVETFITAINHDIKSSKSKNIPRDNITKSERQAILNLQKRNGIIVTKAGKGGAVVILDIKDYIDEADRQVNDTNNYEQLDFH